MGIFLFVASLLFAGLSQAATIAKSDHQNCAISITGSIELGDGELFKHFVRPSPEERDVFGDDYSLKANVRRMVCLDSPGGNFAAGIKIAEVLLEEGIGTMVLAGHKCNSTCAFMFMFGTMGRVDDMRVPSRFLEVDAALGFHAPFLDGNDQGRQDKFFREGIHAIMKFFDALYRPAQNPWGTREGLELYFPIELLVKVLSTSPDDYFRIRTIDDIGRWGIGLSALVYERVPTGDQRKAAIVRGCTNSVEWREHRESRMIDGLSVPLKTVSVENAKIGKRTVFQMGDDKTLRKFDCEVLEYNASVGHAFRLTTRRENEKYFRPRPPVVADESWKTLDARTEICSNECLTRK